MREHVVTDADRQARIHYLRQEVARITNETLRGDFRNPSDRDYWVSRARKLNGELSALEEQCAAGRRAVFTRRQR